MDEHHRLLRRGTPLFLGLSLALHVLLLVLLPAPPRKMDAPRRFRLKPTPQFDRLRPYAAVPPQLPDHAAQRLDAPAFTAPSETVGLAGIRPGQLPFVAIPRPDRMDPLTRSAKTDPLEALERDTLDLNELALAGVLKAARERERYLHLELPGHDLTDAASRSRLKARRIVERCFEAMGGLDSLLAVREMQAKVWIQSHQDAVGGVVKNVPPYVYPLEYWHCGGLATFTIRPIRVTLSLDPARPNPVYALRNPPEKGNFSLLFGPRWVRALYFYPRRGRLRMQGEAARWHFVDRFLGAGIELGYIAAETFGNEPVEAIRIQDCQYGHFEEAFFSRRSGLLRAVREGLTPSEQEAYWRAEGKPPPVWTTVFHRYEEVNGVLIAHVLERWKNNRIPLIIHLRMAYNGELPDESEPPLWKAADTWVPLPPTH